MSTARDFKPHYTVRDYLEWKGDWELWYGSAVSMAASPFAPHERCVTRFTVQFAKAIEKENCNCEVYTGLDWIVNEDTAVRPDVMLVCGKQPQRHLERTPDLTVEVLSESTERLDLGPKKLLYQEQGVSNYLIADPRDCSLQCFVLKDGEFVDRSSETALARNLEISLQDGCRLLIEVAKLFG